MKFYDVPQEVKDLFEASDVAEACRDKAIASVWGVKRAIKFGRMAEKYRREAWDKVWALYPELDSDSIGMAFSRRTQKLEVENKLKKSK